MFPGEFVARPMKGYRVARHDLRRDQSFEWVGLLASMIGHETGRV